MNSLKLFDYDVEVQPILEVLVGKTIEQALTEVLEEEEIASLREQQRKFLELRAAEKAEQQRLEEQDRRLREEKVLIIGIIRQTHATVFFFFFTLSKLILIFFTSRRIDELGSTKRPLKYRRKPRSVWPLPCFLLATSPSFCQRFSRVLKYLASYLMKSKRVIFSRLKFSFQLKPIVFKNCF